MAEINCPGCGEVISDRALKCRKCRYPIGRYSSPVQDDDGSSHLMPREILDSLRSDMVELNPVRNEQGKKLKKAAKLFLAAFLIVVIAVMAVVFISDMPSSSHEIVPVSIKELKLSRLMHIGEENVLNVYSDETKPFAAVISDEKRKNNHYYVLVEDGSCTLRLSSGDLEPKLAGYAEGFKLSENDLSYHEIKVIRKRNKSDDSPDGTIIRADISLDPSLSGIMLYSLAFYDGSYKIENLSVPVCAGKGKITVARPFSLYNPDEMNIHIVPTFFIPVKQGSEQNISFSDASVSAVADPEETIGTSSFADEIYADYDRNNTDSLNVFSVKANGTAQNPGSIVLYSHSVGGTVSGCGVCIPYDNSFEVSKYIYIRDADESNVPEVRIVSGGCIEVLRAEK